MPTSLNTAPDARAPELAPFYYLANFHQVLAWVALRYNAQLDATLVDFMARFRALPHASQCLLVRLLCRQGVLFRINKLNYVEIGELQAAAACLCEAGLLERDPEVTITELATLVTKQELGALFAAELGALNRHKKSAWITQLAEAHPHSAPTSTWTANRYGAFYRLACQAQCDELLLYFFGNARQSLTDFVLADLGIYRYESYVIDDACLVFASRAEVVQYRELVTLREAIDAASDAAQLLALTERLPAQGLNPGLQLRLDRLRNTLAARFEKHQLDEHALALYALTDLPPARERRARICLRQGAAKEAWQQLHAILVAPQSEHEQQVAARMLPRFARHAGQPYKRPVTWMPAAIELHQADLPHAQRIEWQVQGMLHQPDAPCFYVENLLFLGLFGLWLWPELFRSVPGAFANPFQTAPLDVYEPTFSARRPGLAHLWHSFTTDAYKCSIRKHWHTKFGIANPFVQWQALTFEQVELALACISAPHLQHIFKRLLFDLKANRTGLPDLVQFFPAQKAYRLLEVKGPGDRLQDNQLRWLHYFHKHGIPAAVCYVNST